MEPSADCEYLVIGSGAGGGTVAARLAEAGKRVIVLEAGGDPRAEGDRLPEDYDVPAFHAFASENPAMAWDFYVRHFADDAVQRRDKKFVAHADGSRADGIYYPRAATLGGCTAHNAMILVYPHNADWEHIRALTNDASWSAAHMRTYFQRLENCRHRPWHRWLSRIGLNPTRHGFGGWLPSEKAIPRAALTDRRLERVIRGCLREISLEDGNKIDRLRWLLTGSLDPNDWRLVREDAVGVRYLPLTTFQHARSGTRERLRSVAERFPDRLRIVTNALATKIILDDDRRAVGVAYLEGERLYRAHRHPSASAGERRTLQCSREVIVAGGAFNSPQLLMLSGIGPPDELRRFGIAPMVPLPGVGRNLQDRYEISVVDRMAGGAWDVFEGARFDTRDPQFAQWSRHRSGVYATNGSVLTLFKRSRPDVPLPDLFCMAVLADFQGYFPGYSDAFAKNLNALTWVVLKSHTENRAGTVALRSNDPLDTPAIDFNSFADGGDADLKAVVEGVRFVRRVTRQLRARGLVASEIVPGDTVLDDQALSEFVRTNAWGHHACGTCAIGPKEANGVLTSDFRVHGTKGLRVIDASVFPRIPGFFIVSAVYMIAEKAADDLLRDCA